MTKLNFCESGMALLGVRLGFVSITFLVKYDIYCTYLEFKEKAKERNKEAQARFETAEKTKYSYASVCRAIQWFESDLQNSENSESVGIDTFNRSTEKLHGLPLS